MRAGFAETDITPPVGTLKIGWKKIIVSEDVLDPIFARAAVFENGPARVGFIQLDTLSVRWTQASQIRAEIERRFGFPGSNVMVSATHNHAGPAVANAGDVPRDERCVKLLVERSVQAFGDALGRMTEAQVGFGSCFEFRVSHNRRVVMRDGTVRTHGTFSDPMALYIEGPIDPEVCVLAARDLEGELLGAMVNFACHPTHHGPDSFISAGFPGVLAREMKDAGCPVTLYLNGASGNLHTSDPSRGGQDLGMEEAGRILASDAKMVIDSLVFEDDMPLRSVSKTIHLPFRRITRRELEGRVRGAQRFIDNSIYEREMPRLLERIRRMGRQRAEIQVILMGNHAYVGIPAEYFVQLGLRIKEECYPLHALVVGHANGMVGYVPHREAFQRGGYETTLCGSSRLAPEAGDLMADWAIRLAKKAADVE